MTHSPLNMNDVITLSAIVDAAINCKRIAWIHNEEDNVVMYGTARSIGDGIGNHLTAYLDVRNAYLRVTSNAGSDFFLPIRHVMRMYNEGAFVVSPVLPFPEIQ